VSAVGGGWRADHGPFLVLLIVTVVIWVLGELRQSVKHRPEVTAIDWRRELTLRLIMGGGILATVGIYPHVPRAHITPAALGSLLGVGLLWAGVALRLWSFHTLGRYFTLAVQTSSDQPVIADGPYRVLRHPSYTGLLLAIVGVGFLIGNWVAVTGLAVSAACGLAYRIRVEERALLRDLGDRYRVFASTRKRMIPYVW
jgi:protein-S-isoprenylcysteine O-methyltransferase Ste14